MKYVDKILGITQRVDKFMADLNVQFGIGK
jgi:hypothetical protein